MSGTVAMRAEGITVYMSAPEVNPLRRLREALQRREPAQPSTRWRWGRCRGADELRFAGRYWLMRPV
jgi:hypothetical protein